MERPHLALYGKVALKRGTCGECGETSLIVGGKFSCCDEESKAAPTKVTRMTEGRAKRTKPSLGDQEKILAKQENNCFWCGIRFGTLLVKRSKIQAAQVQWDHIRPFVYLADNSADNFVAACHICNGLKHDKVFESIELARKYLIKQWEIRGIEAI